MLSQYRGPFWVRRRCLRPRVERSPTSGQGGLDGALAPELTRTGGVLMFDLVVENAKIVDGTGNPSFREISESGGKIACWEKVGSRGQTYNR